MKKLKALIDGDEILYRVGYRCVDNYYRVFNNGKEVIPFHFKDKKLAEEYFELPDLYILPEADTYTVETHYSMLEREIKDLVRQVEATSYQLYLNDQPLENNFRYHIATILPYKGGRDAFAKPIYHEMLRDYMIDCMGAIVWEGAESDDALSYNQKAKGTIIISQDKDLDMVPGWRRFNNGSIKYITEEEARHSFYTQLLTGDSTDNIPGLYGIGPVKANKILKDCKTEKEYFKTVYEQYRLSFSQLNEKSLFFNKNIIFEEALLEVGRLLWMQRPNMKLWEFPI